MTDKKKVLIVEDEEPMLRVLKEHLCEGGVCTVFTAGNGEEGLKIALEEHPNLILLDIVMPVMDGLSMLRKLREDEWGKNVEVIMLTNLTGKEHLAEALEEGSFEYLVKTDWKLEDLVKKVKDRLG